MARIPVLVIHGGAASRKLGTKRQREVEMSILRVLADTYREMKKGCSALEAVRLATVQLEDDPLYNAGFGSKIQSDGHIRMSASIMDGTRRRFAGCVNVEGVKNPILLAESLLAEPDRVLSDRGAQRFARHKGLEFASPFTAHQIARHEAQTRGKSGTVGAVALDNKGRLAAATSTGGRGFEHPFRVSDSPTCAGTFANSRCAVSATGTGEQIVEMAVAATVCAQVDVGMSLVSAMARTLREARRTRREFGLIAVDRAGNFKGSTTTEALLWGFAKGSLLRFRP